MDEAPDPADLRLLRRLVTVLMAVMIAGVLTIVALLVIRLTRPPAPGLALPESIALPDGARAAAFTQAPGWYAVVTEGGRILIYDRETGALRQSVTVEGGG